MKTCKASNVYFLTSQKLYRSKNFKRFHLLFNTSFPFSYFCNFVAVIKQIIPNVGFIKVFYSILFNASEVILRYIYWGFLRKKKGFKFILKHSHSTMIFFFFFQLGFLLFENWDWIIARGTWWETLVGTKVSHVY